MTRVVAWAGIAALVAAAFALGLRPDGEPPSTAARVDRVAAGLRCPVCQGLSVKDSDSPTARDIRADIRRRLEAGETPDAVRAAYVARYGRWILLRPSGSGFEALVWAVPAGVAGAGAVALAAGFWRWRRQGRGRVPTTEDRLLVATALGGDAGGTGTPA